MTAAVGMTLINARGGKYSSTTMVRDVVTFLKVTPTYKTKIAGVWTNII